MPIYEYECRKCGRSFEYMQSFSEAPKRKCEECGGKLEKKISAAGFILKGGGWYKDLYSSTRPEGKSSEEKAAPAATPEKKPEKKSEKKAKKE